MQTAERLRDEWLALRRQAGDSGAFEDLCPEMERRDLVSRSCRNTQAQRAGFGTVVVEIVKHYINSCRIELLKEIKQIQP